MYICICISRRRTLLKTDVEFQGKSDAPAVANAILFLLSALETHNLNIVIIIHKNTTHVSNGHKVGKACAY